MTLNDCIIDFNRTGACRVDIDKAVCLFTPKCFISRWHDEYKLIRIRNKKAIAMKVQIAPDDANEIIKRLGLVELKSDLFANAATYRVAPTGEGE